MTDRRAKSSPPAKRTSARTVVRRSGGKLPPSYRAFRDDLKDRIQAARVRAVLSVNRELIVLYWDIGKSIVERQRAEGWGKAIVERLATDIQKAFPGMEGFSPRNIWRMRAFYLAWTEEVLKLPQPVAELDDQNLPQPVAEPNGQNLPQPVAEISWGHNVWLLEKVKDPVERLWYAQQTLFNGWSRPVLVHQIETNLYHRKGKAVTNFALTLPPPQSDLAQQALKDPYVFDFISLSQEARERELERGLIEHVRKFLLELGVGFAFVGSQYHLEVAGDDFYPDLLFYHLGLRCFIVIDLKVEPFKPEFAGKMNFYLSAVDEQLRHPDDHPSVGIILCKTKKRLIAEYALRNTMTPIGVSEYKLTRAVPPELKSSFPSIKELEKELSEPGEKNKADRKREKVRRG